jgi:hypothetical protein
VTITIWPVNQPLQESNSLFSSRFDHFSGTT